MAKLNMTPVTGITRVCIKKAKNMLFVVADPEVFKSPVSDTYVIFGEAKIEDMNAQAAAQEAKEFEAPSGVQDTKEDLQSVLAQQEADAGTEVDLTGLDEDEINTIVQQAGCSKAAAAAALRKTGNIVDAILELS
jgi:nascent polypeptide-associated complex subunit alpha